MTSPSRLALSCPRCTVPLAWAYSTVVDRSSYYAHQAVYLHMGPDRYRRLVCHLWEGDV